jgi:hypothetical protein
MTRKVKFDGHEITEADITHVSLVKRGANKTKFAILKAEHAVAREVPIIKADDERHLVYGVVYEPGIPDSHGDWMSAAQIERMAHRFLAKGQVRNVDHQHDLKDSGSTVVESFIARDGDTDFPVGSWVIGAHVPDPKLWQMVKSGEISGFSRYGAGVRTPASIEADKQILIERNLLKESGMGTVRKNFDSPGTAGEQASDTDAQAAERARVAAQYELERRIVVLEGEFRLLELKPGVPEPHRQAGLYSLATEINSLRNALNELRSPVVKYDVLDLLAHGITTGNRLPPISVEVSPQPEQLSKEELAAKRFWGEIADDAMGIKRGQRDATIKKGDGDELLSNSLGLRSMRRPS